MMRSPLARDKGYRCLRCGHPLSAEWTRKFCASCDAKWYDIPKLGRIVNSVRAVTPERAREIQNGWRLVDMGPPREPVLFTQVGDPDKWGEPDARVVSVEEFRRLYMNSFVAPD